MGSGSFSFLSQAAKKLTQARMVRKRAKVFMLSFFSVTFWDDSLNTAKITNNYDSSNNLVFLIFVS